VHGYEQVKNNYVTKCYKCSVNDDDDNKAVPLEAWTGPESSRRWRLPDFKTYDT